MDKSKLAIGVALGVFVGLVTYSAITFVAQRTGMPLRGIDANVINYGASNITSSSVPCAVAGNSLAVPTSTGRLSLEMFNISTTSIRIAVCKGTACSAGAGLAVGNYGAGINLTPPSTTLGIQFYKQDDGYTGPWSCASGGSVAGTLHYWQAQ